MSTVKISELTALSSADAADELVIVDDSAGVTKKITHANLANFGTGTVTAGALALGTGTVTAGAIDFSGLANAAGMTSEVLDDYEEGTWTPVYKGSTTDPSGSYENQIGRYTKIGDLVILYMRIRGGATSSVGSGNILIGGIPFPIVVTGANIAGNGISFSSSFQSNSHPVSLTALHNTSTLGINKFASSDGRSGYTSVTSSDLGTSVSSNLIGATVLYKTA